jgi:anti-sigma regulatory factor (Ser/Thr protein kinase)
VRPVTTAISIAEPTMVAEARRQVATLGERLGFSPTQLGRLAIVTTELATNLVKHADGGELYVNTTTITGSIAVDVVSVDRGPGMKDVDACLRDGFSTAGSPGNGLGAVMRLSSIIEIYSAPDNGTVVRARIPAVEGAPVSEPSAFDVYGICLPHPGELAIGDSWAQVVTERACTILVVDGLGHGPLAADASHEAVATFLTMAPDTMPAIALEDIHNAIRGTRGAVAGVARVDLARRDVRYAGIGNIMAMIIANDETKRLVSHNGTLGSTVRRFHEVVHPLGRGGVLILASDGLATQIDLTKYPGLATRSAALIASVLMRDFRRGRDDATVLVVREAP